MSSVSSPAVDVAVAVSVPVANTQQHLVVITHTKRFPDGSVAHIYSDGMKKCIFKGYFNRTVTVTSIPRFPRMIVHLHEPISMFPPISDWLTDDDTNLYVARAKNAWAEMT